jgi:hypothetical protein
MKNNKYLISVNFTDGTDLNGKEYNNDGELKCPECGSDMKEFVNTFRCRNRGNCNYEYKKFFQIKDSIAIELEK